MENFTRYLMTICTKKTYNNCVSDSKNNKSMEDLLLTVLEILLLIMLIGGGLLVIGMIVLALIEFFTVWI